MYFHVASTWTWQTRHWSSKCSQFVFHFSRLPRSVCVRLYRMNDRFLYSDYHCKWIIMVDGRSIIKGNRNTKDERKTNFIILDGTKMNIMRNKIDFWIWYRKYAILPLRDIFYTRNARLSRGNFKALKAVLWF